MLVVVTVYVNVLSVLILTAVMLRVNDCCCAEVILLSMCFYGTCSFAECCYTKCKYAEFRLSLC
jgi:hypothetical protein